MGSVVRLQSLDAESWCNNQSAPNYEDKVDYEGSDLIKGGRAERHGICEGVLPCVLRESQV